MFLLKYPLFMFLSDFNFSISHLKKHSFKYSKALTSLYSKRKAYQKFTSFRYSYVLTYVKKRQNGSRQEFNSNN